MRGATLHWPEYAIEAGCLAAFMVSAIGCAIAFQHPASPLAVTPAGVLSRLPMGVAMGLTAAAIIHSPLGRRSGAHMNPAVTLAFFRLGRIRALDAVAYVAAQFAGGVGGVAVAFAMFPALASHPSVNFVVTAPGSAGLPAAFAGEAGISALLMLVVLTMSATPSLTRWTGAAAACLVALFIVCEAPLSGMSMNPARSFGSALFGTGGHLWIYFTAPPLGMLAAAELVVRHGAAHRVPCATLRHHSRGRCIFHCGHLETSA